jgi:hypothetical protein
MAKIFFVKPSKNKFRCLETQMHPSRLKFCKPESVQYAVKVPTMIKIITWGRWNDGAGLEPRPIRQVIVLRAPDTSNRLRCLKSRFTISWKAIFLRVIFTAHESCLFSLPQPGRATLCWKRQNIWWSNFFLAFFVFFRQIKPSTFSFYRIFGREHLLQEYIRDDVGVALKLSINQRLPIVSDLYQKLVDFDKKDLALILAVGADESTEALIKYLRVNCIH